MLNAKSLKKKYAKAYSQSQENILYIFTMKSTKIHMNFDYYSICLYGDNVLSTAFQIFCDDWLIDG